MRKIIKNLAFGLVTVMLFAGLLSCGLKGEPASDEELFENVKAAVAEKYGSEFADFTDGEIIRTEDAVGVSMWKAYGEDGLITSYECTAEAEEDGEVISVSMEGHEVFLDFDERLLEHVNAEILQSYVEARITDMYGEAESVTLTRRSLDIKDGKYVIRLEADFVTYEHPVLDGEVLCQCYGSDQVAHELKGECTYELEHDRVENPVCAMPQADNLEYVRQQDFSSPLYNDRNVSGTHSVFTDGGSYDYVYSIEGEFLGLVNADDTVSEYAKAVENGNAVPITDDEKAEIAKKAARELFGEEYADFDLSYVYEDDIFTAGESKANVSLTKSVGEDNLVRLYSCYARVGDDGKLKFILMSGHEYYGGFDESLLDGISREALTEYAEAKLTERYIEISDANIYSISLIRADGEEYLLIQTEFVTRKFPEGPSEVYCPCGALETLEDENETRDCMWRVKYVLNSTAPDVGVFSYEDAMDGYAEEGAGVMREGFKNTEEAKLTNAEEAEARALLECTIECDPSLTWVSYDSGADMWKVRFMEGYLPGPDQTVYMDGNGITRLIVYGE